MPSLNISVVRFNLYLLRWNIKRYGSHINTTKVVNTRNYKKYSGALKYFQIINMKYFSS